jgi:DNA-binding transcriptional LysR family regulator
MLDVRRIRVLCEVARHGSFSAAAAALGYTQPAISRQVATLEAEVGMKLVRRVPQGVVMTDAGRLLVGRGESIIARLTEAELELEALSGLEGGTLRLASFASGAAAIVPLAVAAFRSRHPKVELRIVMADPIESLPRLRAGELDLVLSHDAGAHPASVASEGEPIGIVPTVDYGGVQAVHLFDDPMYVAMRAEHPLAGVERPALESFAEEPWMLATSDTCPDSRLFMRACHAAGFEPTIAFQNDDYQAILGFVAAGVGVALIPDMVARGLRDDVVVRDLDPPAPARPILAAFPSGYRSPAASAMLEVLREVSERWVARRPARAEPSLVA